MIDFIFHSFPCKIYNFYAFTVIYPSQKKDIELELELELLPGSLSVFQLLIFKFQVLFPVFAV